MGNTEWIRLILVNFWGIYFRATRYNDGFEIQVLLLCFVITINTDNNKDAGKKELFSFDNRWDY